MGYFNNTANNETLRFNEINTETEKITGISIEMPAKEVKRAAYSAKPPLLVKNIRLYQYPLWVKIQDTDGEKKIESIQMANAYDAPTLYLLAKKRDDNKEQYVQDNRRIKKEYRSTSSSIREAGSSLGSTTIPAESVGSASVDSYSDEFDQKVQYTSDWMDKSAEKDVGLLEIDTARFFRKFLPPQKSAVESLTPSDGPPLSQPPLIPVNTVMGATPQNVGEESSYIAEKLTLSQNPAYSASVSNQVIQRIAPFNNPSYSSGNMGFRQACREFDAQH